MRKILNIGHRFGKLLVLSQYARYFLCKCDCGNYKKIDCHRVRVGEVTHCGCQYIGSKYSHGILPNNMAAINEVYNTYQRNCKKDDTNFDLNIEDFKTLIQSNCCYCGSIPNNTRRRFRNFKYNGIDKIDPNKGYYLSNCVSCCWQCNLSKTNRNLDVFIEWVKKIKEIKDARASAGI